MQKNQLNKKSKLIIEPEVQPSEQKKHFDPGFRPSDWWLQESEPDKDLGPRIRRSNSLLYLVDGKHQRNANSTVPFSIYLTQAPLLPIEHKPATEPSIQNEAFKQLGSDWKKQEYGNLISKSITLPDSSINVKLTPLPDTRFETLCGQPIESIRLEQLALSKLVEDRRIAQPQTWQKFNSYTTAGETALLNSTLQVRNEQKEHRQKVGAEFKISPQMYTSETTTSNTQKEIQFESLKPFDRQVHTTLLDNALSRVEARLKASIEPLLTLLPENIRESISNKVHEVIQAERPLVALQTNRSWVPIDEASKQLNISDRKLHRIISEGYVTAEKKEVIVPRRMEIVGVSLESLTAGLARYEENHRIGRPLKEEPKQKLSLG